MGVVALVGMSTGGRRRGVRALCIAVLVLVMVDPWLARSAGFALSTLATGGILLLAPRWSDALAGWLPRWLAEAIAVPLSAQVVCTPLVAVLSGQVSLIAVGANLLVAPAVGPTTVVGLVAGLVASVAEPVGQLIGRLAGVPAGWIVLVADQSANLDGASVGWPAGPTTTVGLSVACVAVAAGLPRLLRSPPACLAIVLFAAVVVVRPVGGAGWPPDPWVMVMCDVGQGDAIVLNAGPESAIVVDVGPDPRAVDGCLDRLGIATVPLVVLTHFHADHVGGLAGVLGQRAVGGILVTSLREPPESTADVLAAAAEDDIPVGVAAPGTVVAAGGVRLEFVGPVSSGGSDPNDASLVARAEVGGTSVLLTGDVEANGQRAILATAADLDVDVLKVPHHGSADLDPAFVAATSPAVALVSVGADNTYGHPSSELMALLSAMQVPLRRTDLDADIAVTGSGPTLAVVPRG